MSTATTSSSKEQTPAESAPAPAPVPKEGDAKKAGAEASANPPTEGSRPSDSTNQETKAVEPKAGSTLPKSKHEQILRARPYVIKTSKWTPTGVVEGESILSQTLDKKVFKPGWDYAGEMTLAGVRKLIPGMSSMSLLHKFCNTSGVMISDEGITFEDYLSLVAEEAKVPDEKPASDVKETTESGDGKAEKPIKEGEGKAETPIKNDQAKIETPIKSDQGKAEKSAKSSGVQSVTVYYRATVADKVPTNPMASKPSIDLKLKSDWSPATATLKELGDLKSRINDADYKVTSSKESITAGQLTEQQWDIVLRNCGVFFGWILDPRTHQIRRAPKAAFQLRSKDYRIQGSAPDFVKASTAAQASTQTRSSAPLPTSTTASTSETTAHSGSSLGLKVEARDLNSDNAGIKQNVSESNKQQEIKQGKDHINLKVESNDNIEREKDKAETSANKSSADKSLSSQPESLRVLDRVEMTKSTIADTSSSQKALNAQKSASDLLNQQSAIADEKAAAALKAAADAQEAQRQEAKRIEEQKASLTREAPPYVVTDKSDKGIPNFRVNDDSKIDITVCTHSLMESFAHNDFSSQSTEASVSGGYGGFTAGVTGGMAKSESHERTSNSTDQTQTMVARYKYPRCDVFLYAADLEPTPDLVSLLKEIEITKNINVLRKIHRDYGQLFCQEITLGGRLLSTKTMKSTTKSETETSKEQFKTSVGVQVNTPYGGASVKHEQEQGSSTAKGKTEGKTQETHVFEAVGGDTILVNNPPAWAASVANPNMWRIIERDGLSSLIEMLAQMPGYQKVQAWFVQAIPVLSKFITLDAGHQVTTRLRVISPGNELSLVNTGNVAYYLGHAADEVVTPRLNLIDRSYSNVWTRYDYEKALTLFNPSSFRAPVIFGFEKFTTGDFASGAIYNKQFAQVQWSITAPFAEALTHGTRIILKTVPFKPPEKPKVDEKDTSDPVAHMVVFRTAQGNYLPGMSDRDEYQYWRILKAEGGSPGEHIKAGDHVRLGWSFSDQTTGWRDFQRDIFGRRQTVAPPGRTSDVLYLKVPWARFEKKGVPTAMVMSHQQETTTVVEYLPTLQGNREYWLQDMVFRIDTVENNGRGDADDYLLGNVKQGEDIDHLTIRSVFFSHRVKKSEANLFINKIFNIGISE